MPNQAAALIVFTDLDGTLLDHHSYSWQAATPALDALKAANIPLILNSSKTISEIEELRSELGNQHPFVVENGSAIAIPGGYFNHRENSSEDPEVVCFGADYAQIREKLVALREQHGYHFAGFGDLGVAEVAQLTGLDLAAAGRAKQRSSSEPVLWQNSPGELEKFRKSLQAEGLQLTQGGRFMHVSAAGDKGAAVNWLSRCFATERKPDSVISIGLGDGPNDRPMLEAVDYPVIIHSDHGLPMPLDNSEHLIRTRETGPTGWNAAILELLAQLK